MKRQFKLDKSLSIILRTGYSDMEHKERGGHEIF